ncbi:MAG: PBP1A family penicillin-binding protein [Pseudomonadota bacterium]|nr:PBP1A family penicillin-binding protein [Pseudomonadota bacterium]
MTVEPTPSALVLESDKGEVFATRGVFKGEKLTAAELPPHLAGAVIAIEDRRFYEHPGVDLQGMARAAWRNWQAGGTREGGSTITQQLVRMMYLSPDRTLRRKVQEALLSLWLERHLSKEEILVRYLNTAYFGAGVYGVDAAAKRYFGKKAKELTLSESAMLAGLVRAPSQLAPNRNIEGARKRAALVLHTMVETQAITREQADAARAQPASLRLPPETPPGSNYFVDLVGQDVKRLLGAVPSDLTLRTTLNPDLQELAEAVVAKRLDLEGRAKKAGQAALVAMAYDGAILALVGGRDYEQSQFNRVTQARRQPGSLFKLFVYLTALNQGFTPQTTVVDRPVQIGEWEPQNANGRFRGSMPLRTAFANSVNTVAVQLADTVGLQNVIATARRLGVQSELPAVPSLALGSVEVTLFEMTRAFAAVAANRPSLEPYTIRSVRSGDQTLYSRPAADNQAGEVAGRAAMVDLLTAVVREGTGKAARLPVPVAGKTGTTQEHRDAWFIAFTPDLIVGVWVGNDDSTPMNKVTGGDMPATIWRDFVAQAGPTVAKTKAPPVVAQAPSPPASAGAAPATTSSAAPSPGLVSSLLGLSPTAGPLRGAAQVRDTGTLEIGGQVVRLEGVEGEGGRFARDLARFLRNREIVCEPAGAGDAHRCVFDGEDLSEIVIFNGGARATADAPPNLRAAEERARRSRLGVWRR